MGLEANTTATADAIADAAAHPSVASVESAAGSVHNYLATPEMGQLIQDARPLVREIKSGYKTTEFWAAIAAVISDVTLDLSSKNKFIVSGLAAAYALARGLAKSG